MLELGTISEQHKLAAPMLFEPHSSYQLSKSSSYKLGAGYQQYPRSYKLLDNIPAAPSNSIRANLEPLSRAKEAVSRATSGHKTQLRAASREYTEVTNFKLQELKFRAAAQYRAASVTISELLARPE